LRCGEVARLVPATRAPTSIHRSRLSRLITLPGPPRTASAQARPSAILAAGQAAREQGKSGTDLEWVATGPKGASGGGKTQQDFCAGPRDDVSWCWPPSNESFSSNPIIILITVPLALLEALLDWAVRGTLSGHLSPGRNAGPGEVWRKRMEKS